MTDFHLDAQLEKDCFVLGELRLSLLLLLNNALLPWFILVPRTEATELHELDTHVQATLWQEINTLSKVIKDAYAVEKLNIAAIGNKVRQLHVHVIGRNSTDFCWPDVVWGQQQRRAYHPDEVETIRHEISMRLPDDFHPLDGPEGAN